MKRKRFEIKKNAPRGINGLMGRCGGGWRFKIAIMLGAEQVLIELWWVSINFRWGSLVK